MPHKHSHRHAGGAESETFKRFKTSASLEEHQPEHTIGDTFAHPMRQSSKSGELSPQIFRRKLNSNNRTTLAHCLKETPMGISAAERFQIFEDILNYSGLEQSNPQNHSENKLNCFENLLSNVELMYYGIKSVQNTTSGAEKDQNDFHMSTLDMLMMSGPSCIEPWGSFSVTKISDGGPPAETSISSLTEVLHPATSKHSARSAGAERMGCLFIFYLTALRPPRWPAQSPVSRRVPGLPPRLRRG